MTTRSRQIGNQSWDNETEFELARQETLDAVRKLLDRRLSLLDRLPTYRAEIGVVAGAAGYAAEIFCNTGRKIHIQQVYFSKPSVQITMRLIKASTLSTGGTSTDSAVVPLDSRSAISSSARVKLFTGAPTAGTAIGDVFEEVVGTGDVLWEEFGHLLSNRPLTLHGEDNEALAVNVSGAVTIVGYIEFSEEPA